MDDYQPAGIRPRLTRYKRMSLSQQAIADQQHAGHLEHASWAGVSGWMWFPDNPERRAVLEIVHDESVLALVTANQPRNDLKEAGIGDGLHGFHFVLPSNVFTEATVTFKLRERSSGMEITGSPFVLKNDEASFEWAKEDVARVVNHLVQNGSEDETQELAIFLLQQHDRIAARHQTLTRTRRDMVRHWTESLERLGTLSEAIQGLLMTARYRYGDEVVAIPTSDQPEVSVIIPVHGSFWYTHQCLRSILSNMPDRPIEIIIVDDCSQDETLFASMLLSGVRLLRNEVNLGFVGSVNAGAAVARGKWLLLLNNDTEVTHGWLDELCKTFEQDPKVGIAGSKLVFPSGRLQEVGGIIWRFADGANRGRDGDAEDPRYCYLRDTDYVSGAALMIPRPVWDEVGGLSRDFAPAYYEDVDLCFKVRAAGRRVVVQPCSRVIHHEGVSAGTDVGGSGMKRFQRLNQAKLAKRWSATLAQHGLNGSNPILEDARYVRRRALFIDDSAPMPDKDAGSMASLDHMLSLQRLGYEVHFLPASNMARIPVYTEALERRGIRCYYAPYTWSVEEVLRRSEFKFDIAYVYRPNNASKYIAVIRSFFPDAKILFNVCDLHYLRMEREAELLDRPEVRAAAEQMRETEYAAIRSADHVLVHSSVEAKLIEAALPGTKLTVIPWTVEPQPAPPALQLRMGVAFVGSFSHPPNRDAVNWLIKEVMPLVWEQNPLIRLSVIGSNISDEDRTLASDKVEMLGWVPDITKALQLYRLTIAPLRFGAGLKGKVLSSLAAGLPCVMTPIAAEGMEFPEGLLDLVADTSRSLAIKVCKLHDDEHANAAAVVTGTRYLNETYSQAMIDKRLQGALAGFVNEE